MKVGGSKPEVYRHVVPFRNEQPTQEKMSPINTPSCFMKTNRVYLWSNRPPVYLRPLGVVLFVLKNTRF